MILKVNENYESRFYQLEFCLLNLNLVRLLSEKVEQTFDTVESVETALAGIRASLEGFGPNPVSEDEVHSILLSSGIKLSSTVKIGENELVFQNIMEWYQGSRAVSVFMAKALLGERTRYYGSDLRDALNNAASKAGLDSSAFSKLLLNVESAKSGTPKLEALANETSEALN